MTAQTNVMRSGDVRSLHAQYRDLSVLPLLCGVLAAITCTYCLLAMVTAPPHTAFIAVGVLALIGVIGSDIYCVNTQSSRTLMLPVCGFVLALACSCCLGTVLAVGIAGLDTPMAVVCVVMSCMAVETAILLSIVKDEVLSNITKVVLVATLTADVVGAIVVMFSLPMPLYCATIAVLALFAIQLMPDIAVHVPDRYLMQWREYMTNRWTVRGTIPQPARALTVRDVQDDLRIFVSRYDAGIVVSCIVSIVSFSMLCACNAGGSMFARVGTIAVGSCMTLYFLLKPRQSGRGYERMLLRAAGVATLTVLGLNLTSLLPGFIDIRFWTLVACIAVGLIFIAVMLAQHAGFRSIFLSRIGDGLCFLSMMALPLAAFFAADLFKLLQGGLLQ